MDILWIKFIHITCAVISITGFFIRGLWMMQSSDRLQQRWVKTVPHVNDAVLLASAIYLAVYFHFSPLSQPWLAAKIIGLLVYIALGMLALKPGRSQRVKITAWVLALCAFSYIVGCALTKTPYSWLSLL